MALRTVVWTDGAPATGTEYGPGVTPVCCPECDACIDLIIEATRDGAVLGWMLLDDDATCGHILDSGRYVMDVTGEGWTITVAFNTRKAQETGDSDHDRDAGADVHSTDAAGVSAVVDHGSEEPASTPRAPKARAARKPKGS